MLDRRIFVLAAIAGLGACQTAKPHALSAEEVKALRIVQIDVAYAPGATVTYPFAAMQWAKSKVPAPEGGISYDPANPNAQDPRVLDYGEKLQKAANSPEAQQSARMELAAKLKQEATVQLMEKQSGTRDVKLLLTIANASVMGSENEFTFEAKLTDSKTGRILTEPQMFMGTYREARPAATGSLAGALVSVAVAVAINAYKGDPTLSMLRSGVGNFKTWLNRPE